MAKLEKPKPFSLMLNEDQLKSLKAISEVTLIPLSALVRRGIDRVIEEYGDELKEFTRRPKKGIK
jgi:hypothetical protein